MNVIAISFAVVFLANFVTAEYTVTGDHWGDTRNTDDIEQYAKTLIEEWAKMVSDQDVEDMVKKYTPNSIFIRPGHPPAVGREAAKKLYQAWFDSGVHHVNVDLKRAELMGDNFLFIVVHVCAFNESDEKIESSTHLVVSEKVGDGVEAYLNSVTLDSLSNC